MEDNPNGTITNSDLELAGGLLHLEALTQAFNITNLLSYQKGISSAPRSGSKKVVPLQTSLLLTSCGSSEFNNVPPLHPTV
jgi:hypothetical protein